MRTLSRAAVALVLVVTQSLVGDQTPAFAAKSGGIEEVVVTAQRIEENSQKVPISISAFTDAMIQDRQIVGISDLQINIPNLSYVPDNFGGAELTVRGIGVLIGGNERSAAGPSVPIHVNGISAAVDASVTEFYDVERIEILRGPQGMLYGRTATAGAMNIVTRRPDFDGFGGYVDLEYGDYDHVRIKGAANFCRARDFRLTTESQSGIAVPAIK